MSAPMASTARGVTRVLLLADSPVLRRGLVSMINETAGMQSVGTPGELRRALTLVETARPDAVVVELGAGRTVVDPQIRRVEPSAVPAGKPFVPEVPLTRREQDVLDELIQGQSNRQIGRNLFISEDTVKSHVKAILRKLGARDRAHAVSLVLSSRNGGCTCGAHGLGTPAAEVTDVREYRV